MICNRYGIGSISIGLLQCMSPGKKSLNSYSFVLFDLIGINSRYDSWHQLFPGGVRHCCFNQQSGWCTTFHTFVLGYGAWQDEDRTVTEYLTNWVSPSFIYPFDKAGTCSSSLHSAFQSAFGIHFGIWAGFLVYWCNCMIEWCTWCTTVVCISICGISILPCWSMLICFFQLVQPTADFPTSWQQLHMLGGVPCNGGGSEGDPSWAWEAHWCQGHSSFGVNNVFTESPWSCLQATWGRGCSNSCASKCSSHLWAFAFTWAFGFDQIPGGQLSNDEGLWSQCADCAHDPSQVPEEE